MPVPTTSVKMVVNVYRLLMEAAQNTLALALDVSLDNIVKLVSIV